MLHIRSVALRCATASCVALAASLHVAAARADGVVFDSGCAPRLTLQQQRLFERASAGPDALRRFIDIRRAILQVDIYETAMWAEEETAAQAACASRLSAAVQASESPATSNVGGPR
jgi:hypothetical protein